MSLKMVEKEICWIPQISENFKIKFDDSRVDD